MSTGLLNSLMNARSQTADPAGSPMQVEMLPIDWIVPNPDNKIYHVGDVSRLAEDIRKNGVRQPLEVVRIGSMTYRLIGGERRLTACQELLDDGDERFSSLPCIVLESKGKLDDKIALITANATARELTDGERLAQYEALKDALTAKKQAGQLEGKVRDALCKILGEGSGTLARLNAISANCTEDVKAKLHRGEIGLMEAYRYAQSVAETQRKAKQPEPLKSTSSETIPKTENFTTTPFSDAVTAAETATAEYPEAQRASNHTTEMEPAAAKPGRLDSARENDPAISTTSSKLEKHGYSTLLKLAEKELSKNAVWEFDRNLWMFQLDFYNHSRPGGAYLWKLCDGQRDAYGLAPGEHERYAIILNDGTFKTIGWELYNDALISLANYLDLQ